MRGPYKTAVYILKAQKDYRERHAEKLAEKARIRYQVNRETILEKAKIVRENKKALST